jgi:pimeloyl-ACP methyl ester carboxylesterase
MDIAPARSVAAAAAAAERESPLRESTVDGFRIRYVDVGGGEPVVLLHGYPQDHRCWRHQIAALSRRYRVIAPDWLGWGTSERSLQHVPEYSIEVARISMFLGALGLERVNLIAHDYGGFLGLGFVTAHPKRVLRFGILNSRAHRTFSRLTYPLFALQCFMARRRGLRGLLERLPMGPIHRAMLAPYVRKGCFDRALLDAYVGWLDTFEGRRWLAHYFAHYDPRPRAELDRGLGAIRMPTAVIWGDRDPYLPFSIAEDLGARIAGATVVRLRGADHYPMEERPDDVTRALEVLLERPA